MTTSLTAAALAQVPKGSAGDTRAYVVAVAQQRWTPAPADLRLSPLVNSSFDPNASSAQQRDARDAHDRFTGTPAPESAMRPALVESQAGNVAATVDNGSKQREGIKPFVSRMAKATQHNGEPKRSLHQQGIASNAGQRLKPAAEAGGDSTARELGQTLANDGNSRRKRISALPSGKVAAQHLAHLPSSYWADESHVDSRLAARKSSRHERKLARHGVVPEDSDKDERVREPKSVQVIDRSVPHATRLRRAHKDQRRRRNENAHHTSQDTPSSSEQEQRLDKAGQKRGSITHGKCRPSRSQKKRKPDAAAVSALPSARRTNRRLTTRVDEPRLGLFNHGVSSGPPKASRRAKGSRSAPTDLCFVESHFLAGNRRARQIDLINDRAERSQQRDLRKSQAAPRKHTHARQLSSPGCATSEAEDSRQDQQMRKADDLLSEESELTADSQQHSAYSLALRKQRIHTRAKSDSISDHSEDPENAHAEWKAKGDAPRPEKTAHSYPMRFENDEEEARQAVFELKQQEILRESGSRRFKTYSRASRSVVGAGMDRAPYVGESGESSEKESEDAPAPCKVPPVTVDKVPLRRTASLENGELDSNSHHSEDRHSSPAAPLRHLQPGEEILPPPFIPPSPEHASIPQHNPPLAFGPFALGPKNAWRAAHSRLDLHHELRDATADPANGQRTQARPLLRPLDNTDGQGLGGLEDLARSLQPPPLSVEGRNAQPGSADEGSVSSLDRLLLACEREQLETRDAARMPPVSDLQDHQLSDAPFFMEGADVAVQTSPLPSPHLLPRAHDVESRQTPSEHSSYRPEDEEIEQLHLPFTSMLRDRERNVHFDQEDLDQYPSQHVSRSSSPSMSLPEHDAHEPIADCACASCSRWIVERDEALLREDISPPEEQDEHRLRMDSGSPAFAASSHEHSQSLCITPAHDHHLSPSSRAYVISNEEAFAPRWLKPRDASDRPSQVDADLIPPKDFDGWWRPLRPLR
ncbi:hypothetical protein CBOM_02272 [Ceraceosorus bombacis]|uniref:Uncharacterized protein n=1 Tax=Ceraceosorus bombacis TaxID=401625 RepID=A0A0P1BEW9_9BASI|nr:hypothetical protein CBOM_02272 [Ceraceosorus bombacis]